MLFSFDYIRSKTKECKGCWVFTGSKDKDGYARIRGHFPGEPRKTHLVHRVMFRLVHGTIPRGVLIRHTCDNPPCCNPAHLLAGTQKDNMRDMKERGRTPNRRGSNGPNARLTDDQVAAIRERYASRSDTQRSLAKEYGVHRLTINRIIAGSRWAQA